jgi:hypothetical protein
MPSSRLLSGRLSRSTSLSGRSRCFCGEPIDVKSSSAHVYACHMEAAN